MSDTKSTKTLSEITKGAWKEINDSRRFSVGIGIGEKNQKENGYDLRYPWNYVDSSLERVTHSGHAYENTFGNLIPVEFKNRFKDYIRSLIPPSRVGKAIFLDILGQGSTIAKELGTDIFCRSAGFVLTDMRDDAIKAEDKQNRHTVIQGNALHLNRAVGEIQGWLDGELADVIFFRPEKALNFLPNGQAFYLLMQMHGYEILNTPGTLFAQIKFTKNTEHKVDPIDFLNWSNFVKINFGPSIQVTDNFSGNDNWEQGLAFMLKKNFGAPTAKELFRPISL